jgi:dihydroorotase
MSTLITDARLADKRVVDIFIEGGQISTLNPDTDTDPDRATHTIDADHQLVLPGAIDAHVHFRQPGAGHKETWESGSRAALAGGVTTVIDQPNTDPPTTTGAAFDAKQTYAAAAGVDYGLNGGVTHGWDPETLFERPMCALGEVFLADSTGEMGIELSMFESALHVATSNEALVTVHAEDENQFNPTALHRATDDIGLGARANHWSAYRPANAEVSAVERAIDLAAASGAQLHIAHVSTPEAVDQAVAAGVSCEATPHHLLLSQADAAELGTYGRMNPPLRSEERREALFERLLSGRIDIVATDHAPHTHEEKNTTLKSAPSGVPGVETMLPLLLAKAEQGRLSYERIQAVTATNVAELFGFENKGRIAQGYDADLVFVNPDAVQTITATELETTCGWTPFEGAKGVFPTRTLLRGNVVYENDSYTPIAGHNLCM